VSRLSVAVVQGGPSSEAEVSRASATAVAKALVEAGHAAVRIELDAWLGESLRTGGYDVVFPVVHGAVGEDGSLQGLLEVHEIPYVGSDVLASALAMNKVIARKLFDLAELPVANGIAARRLDEKADAAARRARDTVGRALVVKPAASGSAIGVTRLGEDATDAEVARAIEEVWALDDVALVERFVVGREVTCGVLDLEPGKRPIAFPPTEIAAPSDAFYTYAARYAPGRSVHTCPAEIGANDPLVRDFAIRAHRALGCRDLSRVDFVVGDEEGECVLLEVNTMPGFTGTSLYPEAAAVAGIAFPQLCDRLVTAAQARGSHRRNAPLPLPK
jgi:D-alanine-D-alanine ligase